MISANKIKALLLRTRPSGGTCLRPLDSTPSSTQCQRDLPASRGALILCRDVRLAYGNTLSVYPSVSYLLVEVFNRSSQEDARDDFENKTAEDDKAEENKPEWGNRGLGQVLGSLLDLLLRLAHARLVPLGELKVCPPLLRCLGHCEDVTSEDRGCVEKRRGSRFRIWRSTSSSRLVKK
jgi:hypothetical protein